MSSSDFANYCTLKPSRIGLTITEIKDKGVR